MGTIRTFIGVPIGERVRNNTASVIERLASSTSGYRFVEPENLHISLNFVGEVRDIDVPELCKLIKRDVESFEPFDISLQGVDGFPNATEPRTLWIGVDEGTDELSQLNQKIGDVLSHWGVNKDRFDYKPHLTLGRLKRNGRWNDELVEKVHRLRKHDGGFCAVDRVIVYSSYLDRSGATHTPMATIRLD